uniref:alpha/beta fold hydrolase n=1 Tax=Streptomyces sp. CA-141956 TaxID=3240051 RepID=UPI003F49A0B3
MDELVDVNGTEIRVETRGEGPTVLLIAGLGDPAEAWQAQMDGLSGRYRMIAYDNRGTGRTPLRDEQLSLTVMADDAMGILKALDVENAHVASFSGGSMVAQELALRHPEFVRSLVLVSTWAREDAYLASVIRFWRWLATGAPNGRAMLEALLLWIYTPRAHNDGTVERIIDEMLQSPHPQSPEDFQRQLEAFTGNDTLERLSGIAAPTLVLAGDLDIVTPPRFGRVVAEKIPGAAFEVLKGEAHRPFQESPEAFNARIDAFWQAADGY